MTATSRCARPATGSCSTLGTVADGTHVVRVEAKPSGVFGDSVDAAFAIHVDTRRPAAGPGSDAGRLADGERAERRGRGRLDACASATRASASSCVRRAARSQLDPKLPDGRTKVQFVARDRAGNRSVITRTVAVDRTAPRLHIDRVPALIGTAHPTLRGSLDDASPVTVTAELDGTSVALRGARRQGRARQRRRSRGASRCRCSTSRRACTRSRSRPSTPPATRRPSRPGRSPSTRPRSCGPRRVLGSRRARRRCRAARAPAQVLRPLQGPVHALLQRAHRGGRARLPAARTTCRSRASPRPSCCSSAPSASSCTSTASASS